MVETRERNNAPPEAPRKLNGLVPCNDGLLNFSVTAESDVSSDTTMRLCLVVGFGVSSGWDCQAPLLC